MASQDTYYGDHDREADSFHNGRQPSPSRFSRFSRPLIDSVRNGWQSRSPAYHPLTSANDDKHPRWVQMALSIVAAPRFRRYVIVYLTLFLLGWAGWAFVISPQMQEHADMLRALDPGTRKYGLFGTNSLPRFDDLVLMQTLDSSLLPGSTVDVEKTDEGSPRRLVIVGDVHGCKHECRWCRMGGQNGKCADMVLQYLSYLKRSLFLVQRAII